MALRTGIVVLTQLVKHMCRVLTIFRPAIDGVLASAVSGSVITSTQKGVVDGFLDTAQAACDVLRVVTGY